MPAHKKKDTTVPIARATAEILSEILDFYQYLREFIHDAKYILIE